MRLLVHLSAAFQPFWTSPRSSEPSSGCFGHYSAQCRWLHCSVARLRVCLDGFGSSRRIGVFPRKQIGSFGYRCIGFSVVYAIANLLCLFLLPSPLIDQHSFVSALVTFMYPLFFSYNRNRLACIYFSILFMAVNKSVDSLNEKSHFKESSLFRRYRSFAIVWLVLSILLSVWYSSLLLNLFAVSLSLLWMCAS